MTPRELHGLLREGEWVDLAAAARLERAEITPDTPHIEALLARAWVRLGQPDDANEAAESARRRSTDPDVDLAFGEARLAAGQPGEARLVLQRARKNCPDGSVLAHEVDLAHAMVLQAVGGPELGYSLSVRCLEHARIQGDPIAIEEALVTVGHTAWACGRNDEATDAFERAHARREARGATPVLRAEVLDGLGVCARHDNRPFDAVKHHTEALELWVAGTGEDSGPVSACRHRLAQALHRTGDFLAARNEMALALLATGKTLGKDHVDTWITRFELARYDVDCGQPEVGFPRMTAARAEVARRLGDTHPVVQAMDRFL